MKSIFALFIFLCSQFSVAQNSEQARKQIWTLLKENNKDAYQLMTDLYKFPNEFQLQNMTVSFSEATDFMTYVTDYDKRQVLASISTVVHECTHGYQSKKPMIILSNRSKKIDLNISHLVYYINANEEYLVRQTPTFPSIRIAKKITQELRFFRYDTYINSNQEILGTQVNGIYGLMEEWSAYLNGFRTSIKNFSVYKEMGIEGLKGYLEDTGSIKITYPEFKYYMFTYLSYAREKEKDIYHQIITNTDFKKAYHAIDNAFIRLLNEYTETLSLLKLEVEKQGLTFAFSENYYWLGNEGIGAYNQQYELLLTALKSAQFKAIRADLKI